MKLGKVNHGKKGRKKKIHFELKMKLEMFQRYIILTAREYNVHDKFY